MGWIRPNQSAQMYVFRLQDPSFRDNLEELPPGVEFMSDSRRAAHSRRLVDGGPWYCWGCSAWMRSPAEGVSLNGSSELHVCVRCYETLTTKERIQLNFLMRPTLAGGVGIVETSEALQELLRALASTVRRWKTDDDNPYRTNDTDDGD